MFHSGEINKSQRICICGDNQLCYRKGRLHVHVTPRLADVQIY